MKFSKLNNSNFIQHIKHLISYTIYTGTVVVVIVW